MTVAPTGTPFDAHPPEATEPAAGWRVVAASVTGASHEADGTPCQDWADYRLLPSELLAVAVADGAGSAEAADAGARRAVEAALDALAARFGAATVEDRALALRAAFAEAREALAHLAVAEDRPLSAYATTLTCLVAWPEGAIVGRVGDGFTVVEDAAGGLTTVPRSRPDRGEYANETVFLTSLTSPSSRTGLTNANGPAGSTAATGPATADLDERLEIAELAGPVRAVAVSTDGLLRLAIELAAYRPFPRFFRPLLDFAAAAPAGADAQLAAFLASDRVRARTDDDVTLVLAVRAGPATYRPADPPPDRPT